MDRHHALVAAAFDSIAERGFEGLRLRDVASRAGIDHSTLHHHFATKQDLVAAVVAYATSQFWPTMPRTGRPAERLHHHLAALSRMISGQPRLFTVLAELDLRAQRDPQVRATVQQAEHGWRTALADLLDSDAAVELVIATVKGVSLLPDRATDVLNQLVKLLSDHAKGKTS